MNKESHMPKLPKLADCGDWELNTMAYIAYLLGKLEKDERLRVMRWLADKYLTEQS